MPSATQDLDGVVTVNLGSKGVIELELVSSGEKWGRGSAKDIHSSLKAMVDSPAWHLVKALDTLVSDGGNEIKIDNYPKPRPLSAQEKSPSLCLGSLQVSGRWESTFRRWSPV